MTGPASPRPGSTPVQEPVQHPYTELQRLRGHPLVDTMEHRREIQFSGQLERREAETADAEAGERLRIGPAREHVRHGASARVLGLEGCRHRVDEGPVELGLERLV